MNLIGSRYVFFKSLPSDHPMRAVGESTLASIGSKLNQKKEKDTSLDQHMNNMGTYINFIHDMMLSAQTNEIKFLEQQLSALNKLDGEENELKTWIENFKNGIVDYDKMFLLFNGLLQNADTDQAILNRVRVNAHAVTRNFNKFSQTIQDFLKEAYDENMAQYKAVLFQEEKKLKVNSMRHYTRSFSNIFSDKIHSILRQITHNADFKERLIAAYNNSENLDISDDQFKNIIVNFVVDTALREGELTNKDTTLLSKKIIDDISSDFSSIAKKFGDKDYIYAFDKIGTSLERIALTGQGSVGNFLSTLDKQSIQRIKEKYASGRNNVGLRKDIDTLLQLVTKGQNAAEEISKVQQRVTRQLKSNIKQKYNVTTDISSAEFVANFSDIITPTRTRQSILDQISGVSIKHDALAEAISSHDVQNKLQRILTNKITGSTLKFKADLRFSTGYLNKNASNLIDDNKLEEIIDTTITKYADVFFLKYQEKSHGQTDVALAEEAYQEWIEEMQKNIDKIIDADETIQDKITAKLEVYREFEKTFAASVSVKDYDLYNNELGVHGGSLGSKTAPEQVMKNIYTMYSLGGATELDVEQLMTAVINCGSDMLGSNLREPLQTYLLGGAALIMFDDSFALSDNFLKSMTTKLKGQSVVNIYRVNTRYVPSSYILNEIYNNLIAVYNDLSSENKINDKRNKVTIVNNISSQIVYNYLDFTPQEAWDAVRDYTEQNILIQFSFMGGLLDILERLPKAFNI